MPDYRLCGNWLDSYLELTSSLEARESLHRFTGLSCVSAAIQRKLYIDMDYGRLYPNIYVFIVALSAAARKSTAMNFGQRLLIEAFPDLKIFRDDLTAQGLVKALNHLAIANRNGQRVEEMQSDFVIFADELSNLFDYESSRSSKLSILLTSVFMCPDVYDHLTSRDSLQRLYNLYPVILGATDPGGLNVFPTNATGGLFGRVMWVIEKEKRHTNSGWLEDQDETVLARRELLREMLIHDLQRIHRLEGNFTTKPDARALYTEWYKRLPERSKNDKRTDAFFNRCHATAIQLSMLLSIAESDEKLLTLDHIKSGIRMVEEQWEVIGRVMTFTGTSPYEQQRAKLMIYLQSCPGGAAEHKNVLRHMGINQDEFKKVCDTLVTDGTLRVGPLGGTKRIIVRLTPAGLSWRPPDNVTTE